MNIGIIVYSQTGNTYSVAEKLKKELETSHHTVNIERIEIKDNEQSNSKDIQFKLLPDTDKYDILIFGTYVEAFSLAQVMKKYLEQVNSLENKKIACFVTKKLPFNWTGGNRAIKQMKKICKSKNADICTTGIVKWTDKHREKDIDNVINKISKQIN